MTEVKSKKDSLVKNPMGNPPQSLKALIRSAISSTLLFHYLYLLRCTCLPLEKHDFYYISHILFQVNLIKVNRVEIYMLIR